MKWKFYNGQWHDSQQNAGVPPGNPPASPKEGAQYDDGLLPDPQGYTKQRSSSGNEVWLEDNSYHQISSSASILDHLIDGAFNNHSEWHTSNKVRGNATTSDYYVHDYGTNTLYLLDQSVGNYRTHNGIPIISIVTIGQVKNKFHCF